MCMARYTHVHAQYNFISNRGIRKHLYLFKIRTKHRRNIRSKNHLSTPDWLIIKHLRHIAISKDSESTIVEYLEHFNNKPEVQAIAIELLTPKDLSFETLIYLAASDNPGVRQALLRIRNRNTLPFVILQILSHDKNTDIEIEALDLRTENNLSPYFYPAG